MLEKQNFRPLGRIWIVSAICSAFLSGTSINVLASTPKLNYTLSISKVLEAYDVRLRPNFGADPLYVGIEIHLAEINAFSEVNMDYTITISLNQYWKDERLAFSTGEEKLTFTGDFAKRIWVPDIFFPSDKDSFIHDVTLMNQMVELSGDGSILYGMKFTSRESCQMDLRNFPLDFQNCTVEIESYGYTVRDIVMYWKENPISGVEDIRLPQLRIVAYETNDRIEKLATGIYQRLSLSLKFERNFGYFFFQMYLPAILIVMLSWVSFWISNDATAARVALGITTVLTMTTINNSVRNSLPRISYAAIDVYLVTCFLFVFAALIEYATVNFIFWEWKEMRKRAAEKIARKSGLERRKLPSSKKTRRGLLTNFKLFFTKRAKADNVSQPFQGAQRNIKCSIEEDRDRNEYESFKTNRIRPRLWRSVSLSGPISVDRVIVKNPSKIINRKPRARFLKSFRAKTKSAIAVQDVSSVDNYSRISFPIMFLLFNICYWSVYVNKS